MGGRGAVRGFLIQALAAVLEALAVDREWERITLEPDLAHEKVDIVWCYPSRTKAVQVKSSESQISVSMVRQWAATFQQAFSADEYELQLFGPASSGVTRLREIHGVRIPTPQSVHIDALIGQSAHSLSRYLQLRYLALPTPEQQEALVLALAAKMQAYGSGGKSISRGEFDELMRSWVERSDSAGWKPITRVRTDPTFEIRSAHVVVPYVSRATRQNRGVVEQIRFSVETLIYVTLYGSDAIVIPVHTCTGLLEFPGCIVGVPLLAFAPRLNGRLAGPSYGRLGMVEVSPTEVCLHGTGGFGLRGQATAANPGGPLPSEGVVTIRLQVPRLGKQIELRQDVSGGGSATGGIWEGRA